MYYVYILKCGDGSLYTGITNDLARRLATHKAGKGGTYTRAHGAEKILYTETAKDRSSAQIREAEIKKNNRVEKLRLAQYGDRKATVRYTPAMAKRPDVDIRRKKSSSRKTKKRLAVKSAMLAARKAKKHR